MSSSPTPRSRLIRGNRVGPTVLVHLDGRVQAGAVPPPSTPEAMEETEHAANLVELARERAEQLVAEAAREVDDVRAAGYRSGRVEGYAEGQASARAELAGALASVQSVAREAHAVRTQLIAAAEGDIVQLVIAALEVVLGEQTQIDREVVLRTVSRAIERAGRDNVVRVRVHPDELSLVSARLARRDGTPTTWEVAADGAIGIGGCVVDTRAGSVDARLDVQLAEVARVLRTAVPDAR